MTDAEKYSALAHLRRLLQVTRMPTLAETGLPDPVLDALCDSRMLEIANHVQVPEENRRAKYAVHELTPAAISWMLLYEQAQAAKDASLPGLFRAMWRGKLVELVWGLIGLGAGAIIGWHLNSVFGR